MLGICLYIAFILLPTHMPILSTTSDPMTAYRVKSTSLVPVLNFIVYVPINTTTLHTTPQYVYNMYRNYVIVFVSFYPP